mmetsp:Transcript_27957/g.89000  ORF Transcript_27957/g.89000 Transcript_27957/m.89000 type:complete len:208 (+) Transcript_27957:355-978(+)
MAQQRYDGRLRLCGHRQVQRGAAVDTLERRVRPDVEQHRHDVRVVVLGREHERRLALLVLPVGVVLQPRRGRQQRTGRPDQPGARKLVQWHLALLVLDSQVGLGLDHREGSVGVLEFARLQEHDGWVSSRGRRVDWRREFNEGDARRFAHLLGPPNATPKATAAEAGSTPAGLLGAWHLRRGKLLLLLHRQLGQLCLHLEQFEDRLI